MSNLLLETPFMDYIEKVTVKANWGQRCSARAHTYLVPKKILINVDGMLSDSNLR